MNSISEIMRDWISKTSEMSAAALILLIFMSSIVFDSRASNIETPFDKLINASADVAFVQIEDGKMLRNGADGCGGIYKATVIKQHKGPPVRTLVFGSTEGLVIGEKYFVSLYDGNTYVKDQTGILNFRLATFSDEQRDRIMKRWNSCQKLLPDRMIGGDGFGVMLIDTPFELGGTTDAIKVPSLTIRLPLGIQCVQATSVEDYDKALDAIWVALPEMERMLLQAVDRSSVRDESGRASPRSCPSPPADRLGEFDAASTLWKLVDKLENEMPLTKAGFEATLGAPMHLVEQDRLEPKWIGGPINIRDDLGMVSSSIRLGPSDRFDQASEAIMRLIGDCIRFSEVEAYYGKLSIVGRSQGTSHSEAIYRSPRKWGSLYFGFEAIAPGCLAYVSLRGS